MQERKAVHYGQVEIVPGTICDGYVLDDGTPVMSLRGTADLLGMDHKTLKAVGGNSPPKTLKPFVTKGWSVGGNFVKVTSKTSPHCGREIEVYTTKTIRLLIHTYASAFINDGLRKNQKHIGKRAINLSISLVDTALDAVIIEACGLPVNIQAVAKDKYTDIVELLKESNFHCSLKGKDIAIKTDISEFLDVPLNTLNRYLRKHKDVIKPIKLDLATIRTISPKGNNMNGYCLKDVGTIALGMDSVIGIELKEKMFGEHPSQI